VLAAIGEEPVAVEAELVGISADLELLPCEADVLDDA
jgi:hypothetical protein